MLCIIVACVVILIFLIFICCLMCIDPSKRGKIPEDDTDDEEGKD